MSAEPTYRTENGKQVANIFTVRLPAWHREGTVFDEPPTLEQGMEKAGHNFEVEVVPAFKKIVYAGVNGETPTEDYVESASARLTVRKDTGAELGSVGTWYTPLQNRDAFGVLTPLLDAGIATLETGGTLRGGADVWMLAKFDLDRFGPVVREVFADEVIPYATIANNHSGRRGVLVSLTPIRVVCANTLGMAETSATRGIDRAITLRHTANVEAKLVEAAESLLQGLIERYEIVAQQYRRLRAFHLDTAMFRELVLDAVAPDPRDNPRFNPEAMMAESTVARAEKKRAELTRLWREGDGHAGDESAWEAYNAVAQALDHNAELWPTRTGVYRTQSLLEGAYGEAKQVTLNNLVRAAEKAGV